ncbi:hypothetical protein [Novosphingobium sp. TH158]|uniref:hypothetical protein n=1 Tax=Novosphingobium sp. TH158 TaxID=2067455 RepID=UPI001181A922|nr:hypothetical protein [Novosphingobium sp. TH158]
MKRALAIVPLLLAAAAPAHAAPGDMSVAAFLAKVDALKAKGIAAMFSSDIKMLKNEAMAAGLAYKARLERERAAGKPSSCPPKPTKVTQDMWLNHLNSYPAGQRGQINLHRAMADLAVRTWPCR